jgi:hypothetical protein
MQSVNAPFRESRLRTVQQGNGLGASVSQSVSDHSEATIRTSVLFGPPHNSTMNCEEEPKERNVFRLLRRLSPPKYYKRNPKIVLTDFSRLSYLLCSTSTARLASLALAAQSEANSLYALANLSTSK